MKRYEREGFSSYVIYELDTIEPDYDIQVLTHIKLNYIANLEFRVVNGRIQLYYNIDHLQLCSAIWQKGKMKYNDIRDILTSILEVFYELQELLLDYDSLMLDMEQMYWDSQAHRAMFVYVPEEGKPIFEQLKHLLEQLMPLVSVEDGKATECIYNLYQEAICNRLNEEMLRKCCLGQEIGELRLRERTCTRKNIVEASEGQWEEYEENKIEDGNYYVKQTVWQQLKKWGRKCLDILKKTDCSKQLLSNVSCAETVVEDIIHQIDSVQYQQEEPQTTVLSLVQAVPFLKPMDARYPMIKPVEKKQIIGRMDSLCDFVIGERNISRTHASIELREGSLVLMDLNSANGTYVNEILIETNSETQLTSGDVVRFGMVTYVTV